jgi:hypothetical protein
MNVSHRPLLVLALLTPVLAACGSADESATSGAAAPMPNQQLGKGVDRWDPNVGGRELMSLKRIGNFMGTSDLVKYGSDGSVVVVKLYGGGGSGIERCRLHAGELVRLRRDVRRLPLGPPPHVRERPRPTFYTPPAPQYVLTNGRDIETFTQDAMPRDARPLVRRLVRTLNGSVATCHTVYRTRRA